jgi:SAM-dependent methyltransferase
MNTELFEDPAHARFYDLDSPWSEDRDFCLALAAEAKSALDLGCGTGSLAARMGEGRRVVGVDPAEAMLDIARRRPGGDAVAWVRGDGRSVRLGERFDLVVLTGHAFQVFLSDEDQREVCRTIAAHLAPGGRFIFDSRNPAREEWREWTPERSRRTLAHPELGPVEVWNDVAFDAATGIAAYGTHHRLPGDGRVLSSTSRIRFASKDEIAARLAEAGLRADQWLGDWRGGAYAPDAFEIIPLGRRAA